MEDSQLLAVAVFWIGINAVIGYLIGKPKDDVGVSAVTCVILGPLGWIVALCSKSNLRPCPHCAENVKQDALVCRYCRGELPAIPPPKPEPPPSLRVTAVMGSIVLLVFAGAIGAGLLLRSRATTANTQPSTMPLAVTATPMTNTTRWEAPPGGTVIDADTALMTRLGFSKTEIVKVNTENKARAAALAARR